MLLAFKAGSVRTFGGGKAQGGRWEFLDGKKAMVYGGGDNSLLEKRCEARLQVSVESCLKLPSTATVSF